MAPRMSTIMIGRSSYRLAPSPPYMAPLLYVSSSILRVVCETYLVNNSGTVIGYRISYRRFVIIIYNLLKGVGLFVVLPKKVI